LRAFNSPTQKLSGQSDGFGGSGFLPKMEDGGESWLGSLILVLGSVLDEVSASAKYREV
jgi:hypothetical protein